MTQRHTNYANHGDLRLSNVHDEKGREGEREKENEKERERERERERENYISLTQVIFKPFLILLKSFAGAFPPFLSDNRSRGGRGRTNDGR